MHEDRVPLYSMESKWASPEVDHEEEEYSVDVAYLNSPDYKHYSTKPLAIWEDGVVHCTDKLVGDGVGWRGGTLPADTAVHFLQTWSSIHHQSGMQLPPMHLIHHQ